MGLFDIFTGDPAKEAAEKQRAFFDQTKRDARSDIEGGLAKSQGYVQTGTGAARNDLKTGYSTATGAVNTGATDALAYLDKGTLASLGKLDTARTEFDPLAALGAKYGAGTSTYMDALGVNGGDAATAARASFTPSLSYDFTLNQGLDAINRRRNAGGMLASGNADRDAQDYVTGVASKESNAWMDRLAALINPELAATSGAATGRAGVDTNSANLLNTQGTNQASVASNRGAMLADLATRYGTGNASLNVNEGNTLAGLETGATTQKVGVATGLAQPYAGTYKTEADAAMAGSANAWGAIMQGAKLLAGGMGGMPGMGAGGGGAGAGLGVPIGGTRIAGPGDAGFSGWS